MPKFGLPFNEDEKSEICNKVLEISKLLYEIDNTDFGLMGGNAGLALFFFYASRATGDRRLSERGEELITRAFASVGRGNNKQLVFSSGLSGLAWTVAHLKENEFIEADLDDAFEILTVPFQVAMMSYLRRGEYDYLNGALGIALYFLERYDLPEIGHFWQDVLSELAKHAQADEKGGLKWPSILDVRTKERGFNLSLSHGQAGIIDILGRLINSGYVESNLAYDLINGAVAYILGQEIRETDVKDSMFPLWISPISPPPQSRLGWCYGDLGIGLVLFHAGIRLNEGNWRTKGLDILHNTLTQRDPEKFLIKDACLCHGSAGIAHIYHRLWKETEEEDFATSARFWFNHSLKLASFPDGLAGFKAWRSPEQGGWANDSGFLGGLSGIGLALVSAISHLDPNWDRCLLLS